MHIKIVFGYEEQKSVPIACTMRAKYLYIKIVIEYKERQY